MDVSSQEIGFLKNYQNLEEEFDRLRSCSKTSPMWDRRVNNVGLQLSDISVPDLVPAVDWYTIARPLTKTTGFSGWKGEHLHTYLLCDSDSNGSDASQKVTNKVCKEFSGGSESSVIPAESPPKLGTIITQSSLKQRKEVFGHCVFCERNGERKNYAYTHLLRDPESNAIVCPILRAYVCPMCGGTGDGAHTISYCPLMKSKTKRKAVTVALKSTPRNSTGFRK